MVASRFELVVSLTHGRSSRPMSSPAPTAVLDTKRGKQILMLLLAVAFLDFVDASIVNVALPSIRSDLGFSVQNLQWVLSGYLLTYGGLMLLGGRASDLFGRRRLLVAGTLLFAVSSFAAGVAPDDSVLFVARLIQGAGAAMMIPAALSILTTTFSEPGDRYKALGAWGAIGGLASAVGVFLGGVITDFLDWRWVFFVNLPAAALILRAVFRLVPADEKVERRESLDVLGALLVTAGMLLLVYTMFLLITLYMQNVLGLSPLEAGSAYLAPSLTVVISAGIATNLMGRLGTRPVIVIGAILGAGGIFRLSKIPVDGSYWSNLLAPLVLTAFGLGGVLVGTTTAAQNGVSPDKAGLAAALINSSMWLGGALGVAIFTAVATSTTADRLPQHPSPPPAPPPGVPPGPFVG